MKRIALLIICIGAGFTSLRAGVVSGPWVTEVREDRVTLVWTSEQPGMAYVELEDGTQVWETFAGRRIFGRLHRIRISGLAPGGILRYRVCGTDLVDDSNARQPVFGDSYEGPWHAVRTFDRKKKTCRFSVFNDIHMQTGPFAALAAQVDSAETDFLFLNGDIVSAANYDLDSLVRYAVDPLGNLPAGLPLLFARGNHEGRGNNVQLVADVFPNEDPAPFYYAFREGPVAFLVLDGGETSSTRSLLFSGEPFYDEYLTEQLEWVRKTVREPFFRKAPVKVCLVHVPLIDHEDKTDYIIQRHLHERFTPLLNKAGVDLMIGADLHEFMYFEAGAMGNRFPVIVNGEVRRLDFSCENKTVTVRTFNTDGALEFERTF